MVHKVIRKGDRKVSCCDAEVGSSGDGGSAILERRLLFPGDGATELG